MTVDFSAGEVYWEDPGGIVEPWCLLPGDSNGPLTIDVGSGGFRSIDVASNSSSLWNGTFPWWGQGAWTSSDTVLMADGGTIREIGYDPVNDSFSTFGVQSGTGNDSMYQIAVAPDGTVWATTNQRMIYKFAADGTMLRAYNNASPSAELPDRPRAMWFEGDLLYLAAGSGIWVANVNDEYDGDPPFEWWILPFTSIYPTVPDNWTANANWQSIVVIEDAAYFSHQSTDELWSVSTSGGAAAVVWDGGGGGNGGMYHLSTDGAYLYACQPWINRIYRWPLSSEAAPSDDRIVIAGPLGDPSPFAEINGPGGKMQPGWEKGLRHGYAQDGDFIWDIDATTEFPAVNDNLHHAEMIPLDCKHAVALYRWEASPGYSPVRAAALELNEDGGLIDLYRDFDVTDARTDSVLSTPEGIDAILLSFEDMIGHIAFGYTDNWDTNGDSTRVGVLRVDLSGTGPVFEVVDITVRLDDPSQRAFAGMTRLSDTKFVVAYDGWQAAPLTQFDSTGASYSNTNQFTKVQVFELVGDVLTTGTPLVLPGRNSPLGLCTVDETRILIASAMDDRDIWKTQSKVGDTNLYRPGLLVRTCDVDGLTLTENTAGAAVQADVYANLDYGCYPGVGMLDESTAVVAYGRQAQIVPSVDYHNSPPGGGTSLGARETVYLFDYATSLATDGTDLFLGTEDGLRGGDVYRLETLTSPTTVTVHEDFAYAQFIHYYDGVLYAAEYLDTENTVGIYKVTAGTKTLFADMTGLPYENPWSFSFRPATGHMYVVTWDTGHLYEFDTSGTLVATRTGTGWAQGAWYNDLLYLTAPQADGQIDVFDPTDGSFSTLIPSVRVILGGGVGQSNRSIVAASDRLWLLDDDYEAIISFAPDGTDVKIEAETTGWASRTSMVEINGYLYYTVLSGVEGVYRYKIEGQAGSPYIEPGEPYSAVQQWTGEGATYRTDFGNTYTEWVPEVPAAMRFTVNADGSVEPAGVPHILDASPTRFKPVDYWRTGDTTNITTVGLSSAINGMHAEVVDEYMVASWAAHDSYNPSFTPNQSNLVRGSQDIFMATVIVLDDTSPSGLSSTGFRHLSYTYGSYEWLPWMRLRNFPGTEWYAAMAWPGSDPIVDGNIEDGAVPEGFPDDFWTSTTFGYYPNMGSSSTSPNKAVFMYDDWEYWNLNDVTEKYGLWPDALIDEEPPDSSRRLRAWGILRATPYRIPAPPGGPTKATLGDEKYKVYRQRRFPKSH